MLLNVNILGEGLFDSHIHFSVARTSITVEFQSRRAIFSTNSLHAVFGSPFSSALFSSALNHSLGKKRTVPERIKGHNIASKSTRVSVCAVCARG